MNLLPTQAGARPRLACELSGSGVVCGRSESSSGPVTAVGKAELASGAIVPGLRPGNVIDRVAVIAAVRRTMDAIGAKPGRGNVFLTLVIPDAAVRVLLLDFDALPNKLSEALPLVRFRLKKLLPFDADSAMVTYQVMSQSKSVTRVLAVALPRDVLSEYESVAREAGYEPGAVLPSTLAAIAGLSGAPNSAANEETDAALLVNAGPLGVTTAIVKGGMLLLHRSVDLTEHAPAFLSPEPQTAPVMPMLPAELFESGEPVQVMPVPRLTIVDHEETIEEWAAQEAMPEHGRDPYAEREAEVQAAEGHGSGLTDMAAAAVFEYEGGYEAAPVGRSPYAGATVAADLNAELHNAILVAPTSLGTLTDPAFAEDLRELAGDRARFAPEFDQQEVPVHTLAPDVLAEELARAVSVAVAYFEDTLAVAPRTILSAGWIGAERLNRVLETQGIAEAEGLRVREVVDPAVLTAAGNVARGALAGVVGALRG